MPCAKRWISIDTKRGETMEVVFVEGAKLRSFSSGCTVSASVLEIASLCTSQQKFQDPNYSILVSSESVCHPSMEFHNHQSI